MGKKIRFEEMLPDELKKEMRKHPVVYLPLGTLKWHGRHLALGNDAIKAHQLCCLIAEKAGGVVVPAL